MRNWILIADASRASVFVPFPDRKELERVREYSDPQGRARTAELGGDRPGRSRSATPGASFAPSMAAHTDPHAAELERFVREIAADLSLAHHRLEFDRLALIAPPQFLGALRRSLDDQVSKAVVSSVSLDLTPIPWCDLWPHVSGIARDLAVSQSKT